MTYTGKKTKTISFPIGGIGTGSIGLAGNGELIDWEIFNRPNKGTRNGYSHFAIKAKVGDEVVAKVLHGDTNESLMGEIPSEFHSGFGYGPHYNSLAGFTHFKDVSFGGTFPIAKMRFSESDFPGVVRLCAFNPFIPHDEYNSSLPAAFFEWEIENSTEKNVEYSLAFTVMNPANPSVNTAIAKKTHRGVILVNSGKKKNEIGYTDLCVLTDEKDVVTEAYWFRGPWKDPATVYWRNFTDMDRMPARDYDKAGACDHATVASYFTVPAGEKKRVRFVLAWNVPNQYNYWKPYVDENGDHVTWKNYYATVFKDSYATARYALRKYSSLYRQTKRFADALAKSTLPPFVKDAVTTNLSVLKTATCLRLEDGSFWGWEGCAGRAGSCEGTCQHVWNYAYAMPYLFPRLERSIRENVIKYTMNEAGKTAFRMPLPQGRVPTEQRACADGQMGEIIKCYREWKLSGDNDWLRRHADAIFKMLEYAWSEENPHKWDADKDGIMEGRQHHTLDMELFGPNSWLEGFYLLALDCGAKMADALGETEKAKLYRSLYENGKRFTNEELFNGRYFMHKVDLTDKSITERYGAPEYWNDEAGEIKYQVYDGCIIDQMLADWHAALIGAAPVFDKDKKKIALESLYKYNYRSSMRDIANMWRNFSLNDEAGTMICSYPEGCKKPIIPILYCEETMTGFEYSLAGLMLAENMIEEGETLVKAIRDRFDGEKRNPFNEFECGSNYARSMASYALMPIYSGFSFDMTKGYIGFSPIKKGDGRYVWSVADSWGSVSYADKKCTLTVLGDSLTLSAFSAGDEISSLRVDGKRLDFRKEDGSIVFETVTVKKVLEVELL